MHPPPCKVALLLYIVEEIWLQGSTPIMDQSDSAIWLRCWSLSAISRLLHHALVHEKNPYIIYIGISKWGKKRMYIYTSSSFSTIEGKNCFFHMMPGHGNQVLRQPRSHAGRSNNFAHAQTVCSRPPFLPSRPVNEPISAMKCITLGCMSKVPRRYIIISTCSSLNN